MRYTTRKNIQINQTDDYMMFTELTSRFRIVISNPDDVKKVDRLFRGKLHDLSIGEIKRALKENQIHFEAFYLGG